MSLVAYDASSDEDSDYEEENTAKAVIVVKPVVPVKAIEAQDTLVDGHISDEDDEYIATPEDSVHIPTNLSKLLPKPKNETNLAEILENFAKPTFTALPTPKASSKPVEIEEVDDEFLHKKVPIEIIEKPQIKTAVKKMPVKITIPSLKNFTDVDKEIAEKSKNKSVSGQTKSQNCSGLLSILPKAKSEQNFAKPTNMSASAAAASTVKPITPAFVPDTVKHRRPATNTEEVDRLKVAKKKVTNQKSNKREPTKNHDSDESGDDEPSSQTAGDFFSFNTDHSLPTVSAMEINDLVAKKAAKMAETTSKYLNATEAQTINESETKMDQQEIEASRKRYHEQQQQLNPEAIQALVGSNGIKRRRQQKEGIQVIDINSSQVLPDRDEWMRTALASSTTYQPTGVLVDEEPASGTRRKHQITYLAHKAKANEAELQAMWSANRQNRRATQNKYGF